MHLAAYKTTLDDLPLAFQKRHEDDKELDTSVPGSCRHRDQEAWESLLGDLNAQEEQIWAELPSKPDGIERQ